MRQVTAYTDGACSGNPGPGGWGAILECDGVAKELSGAAANTTNNRMELMAVIMALEALTESCAVTVVTDSAYVANAFKQNWLAKWQKNGWRTAAKKPVKNMELWQRLLAVSRRHQVKWQWVKGHAGHPQNERADALAVAAREAL